MATPTSTDARLFYRCAFARYGAAQKLLDLGLTTDAIYIAGYGVECILKALLLETVTAGERAGIIAQFRGGRAHDYDWLRELYVDHGGAGLPVPVESHFNLVSSWSPSLRYVPRTASLKEATNFLAAVDAIMQWADGRI